MQRDIFDDEHEAFRELVREFIKREVTPYHEQWERNKVVSRDVWLAAGRAGYLKRRILPDDANRVHALGEPALESTRENERLYPQGQLAASVLGFVAADGHGRVGMEQVFDRQLSDYATRGTPQVLSIDARVQGALEDELQRGIDLSGAKPVLAYNDLIGEPGYDYTYGAVGLDAAGDVFETYSRSTPSSTPSAAVVGPGFDVLLEPSTPGTNS